jgi:bacterioferritin
VSEEKQAEIIEGLKVAYWMEIETVMSYIANSTNLDGVRAEEIKKALAADVQAELGHAQTLARRIKTLGGSVPGSMAFKATQEALQPPEDRTDVLSVIKGVIAAENGAIAQYNKLIRLCDGVDYVTQDLCIQSLADEEEHRRDFLGYLTEYEQRSS